MDCPAARALWLEHQGQMPGSAAPEAWRLHCRDCRDCQMWEQQTRHFESELRDAMQHVAIPEGLQGRLLERLEQSTPRHRAKPKRLHRTLALAALLLFAAWLAFFVDMQWGDSAIDLNALEQWAKTRWTNPATMTQDATVRQIEVFFKQEHQLAVKLPPVITRYWDFRLCTQAYLQPHHGDKLAVLEFRRGASHALVVLLRHEQVDSEHGMPYYRGEIKGSYLLVPSPTEGNIVFIVMKSGIPDDFRLAAAA